MACHHVFALHDAKEKWQGASLLESGRKPPQRSADRGAFCRRANGAGRRRASHSSPAQRLRSAQRSPMGWGAGWSVSSTINSSWTSSGRSVCRPGARAPDGILFYKRYVYIVLSSLAVSGVCIDTGLIAVLYLSSLVQTSV